MRNLRLYTNLSQHLTPRPHAGAKAYASVWPVKKNKWRWARDNFDKHFYGVGAGVVGLSGILYALYAISVCVSMAGVGLSSIHFIHFIFTCVSTVVDAGWPAVCAAACVFVTWIVGTVIQVAARWRGMGVRYAAGIGYGVSNGSACMILLVCYGTGLTWPLYVGTQLLLAAPPLRLMLGFDDRILRLLEGPSQLLLPAPRASLGIAIGKELVIWTGMSLVASAGFSSTPHVVFTLLIVVVCAFLVEDWNPTLMACALLGAALFFGAQLTGFDWADWAGAMGPIFSYARSAVGWLLVLRWWCLLFVEGFYRWVIVDVHFPVTRLNYLDKDGNPSSWKSLVARPHRGFDLQPGPDLRDRVLETCKKYSRWYLLDPVRISIMNDSEAARKNVWNGLISGIYGLLFHAQLDLAVPERNFLYVDVKHYHLECTIITSLRAFTIGLLTSLLVARALLGQGGGFIWERPDLGAFAELPDDAFKQLKVKDLTLSPTKLRAQSPITTNHARSLSLHASLTELLAKREFGPSVTVKKSYPSII